MAGESNRRGFLRDLVVQAARGAGELIGQAQSAMETTNDDASPIPVDAFESPRANPTPPPNRCASLDDVSALVDEVGLDARLESVLALCRWSLRLNPSADAPTELPNPGGSAASPDLLQCVVELNLERLGGLGQPGLLPSVGLLGLFVQGVWSPPDTYGEHTRGCSAVWSPAPAPEVPTAVAAGLTLEVAPELTLPRLWAEPVQALGLGGDEMQAWEDLRHRLAGIQGVVVFDDALEPESLHRLLGYPDDRQGNMPLASEMLANGVELGDGPAFTHPRATEFMEGAHRWVLLAQLSDDRRLGWSWGRGDERLYMWIHEAKLAARDFANVLAFVQ